MSNPFIIGEVSCNHNGSISQAKKIIKLAKSANLSAVKLQTYTPETMTIDSSKKDFIVKNGLWKGYKLWDLYKIAQTPFEWQEELFKYAKQKGIKCFSTPFDLKALEILEKINCPFYKVSSFEMNDLELISKIAQTRKKLLFLLVWLSLKEIEKAFNTAYKNQAKEINLLYCVSIYPASVDDFHLENIKILKDKFNCEVGLSDHSIDNKVAIVAAAMGATIFEKHIALENQKRSPDIKFSLKGKKKITKYKEDIILGQKLKNKKIFYRSPKELKGRVFRRSIYVVKKIQKGEKFTKNNVKKIRPGFSINAIYFDQILNQKAKKNYSIGERLSDNYIKYEI